MPLIHRKMGDPVETSAETSKKLYESCDVCYFCPYACTNYSSPPPPPPATSHHQFSTVLILMICGLGLVFLLFSYLIIARCRSMSLRNSRRILSQSPALGNDGLSENDQGTVMDHHVWYIRTVGLPQSLIDSIPVFDYRRGEKMIEGSDHCPVCLNEFQENESLRLLPMCSHAFHVLCIDTWLGSHKNCPVCRSPVSISNTYTSVATSTNMGSDHSGSVQGPEFEASGTTNRGAVHENGGESRASSEKRAFRVLSDLGDRRVPEVDRELERVRRSVSMDYSSDSVLVESHANRLEEGCSDT